MSRKSLSKAFLGVSIVLLSFTSLSWVNAQNSSANSISALLLDQSTGEPIENAFIFIRNTSISTVSDITGSFQIKTTAFPTGELVFTHLNYQTFSVRLNPNLSFPDIVELKPKTQNLKMVQVQGKRLRSKKRKQWMKQFEIAFFGEGKHRKGMELLNPEVIWFQEKEGELIAEAVDYLAILNTNLGYKLRFYLEDFKVNGKEAIQYAGKVYFEDLIDQVKNKKRYQKKRQKVYLKSKRPFFKALIENSLDSENYLLGIAEVDDNRAIIGYEPLEIDSLTIRRGLFSDTLLIKDYFTFTNKKVVARWGRGTLLDSYATGYFKSKKDRIIVDHSGEILNAKELIEVGYWTSQRVAHLLPLEYNFSRTTLPELAPDKIARQLIEQTRNEPQEKIYLHLNKPYYSLTESIWFKAYLVNAHTHKANTLSKVVYVDLMDSEGQIAKSWTLHTDKVMEGDFRFNNSFQPGMYQLRAYTNFMRNQGPDFFFKKDIPIYDYRLPENQAVKVVQASQKVQMVDKKEVIEVDFYPEGGYLVEGLPANVAFSVRDEFEEILPVEGEIINSKGKLISKIKTHHNGIGLFNLIPEKAEDYQAVFEKSGQKIVIDLPKAVPKGVVMRINNRQASKLFIDLKATDEDLISNGFLVGHVRGQIFCLKEEIDPTKPIVIQKASFPTGVVHFTFFKEDGQPLVERLIFNEIGLDEEVIHLEIAENIVEPRAQITLSLQSLVDSLNWQSANLSLSVTDQSVVKYPNDGENMTSHLLLNSELPQPIQKANFYLDKIDNTKRFWLDLLLMTYGWRRFKWQDLNKPPSERFTFSAETGYSLKGYTTVKDEPENRIQTEVLLTSLDNSMIYETQMTDEQGNFHFQNLPYLDSIHFIIQGRIVKKKKNKKDSEIKLEGDRMVDFHFEKPEKPVVTVRSKTDLPTDFSLSNYLAYEKQSDQLDSIYNSIWQIDFDQEVVVKAARKRYRYGNTFDLNEMDWIHPSKRGIFLLASLRSFGYYEMNGLGDKLLWVYRGDKYPVSISINGFGADKNGSIPYRFLTLEADLIDYISVNGPSISVTTRGIPRSLEIKLESGILDFSHPGYEKAREFYAPNYEESLPIHEASDLRTAIHWVPNIELTKQQPTNLTFYAADTPTTYEIRLEGITDQGYPIFKQAFLRVGEEK